MKRPMFSDNKEKQDRSSHSTTASATDIEASINADSKPAVKWTPTKQEWLAMVTLAVSSLVVALDSTILVPVLPTLAISLHGSSLDAFWAGTSYLLANAVSQPVLVALSDVFGRRQILLPCLLLFALASIICAVAPDFAALLTGRVLQGVGGGGIVALSQVVFADMVPLRQRPQYFAVVLASYAFGTMLGPLLGAVFSEKATWRWCFYINLPILGIALPMTFFFLNINPAQPTTKPASKPIFAKLRLVDWPGSIFFTASLTVILLCLSWAGTQHAWSSVAVLLPLILGVVFLMATIVYSTHYSDSPNPVFPKSLLFPTIHSTTTLALYTLSLSQGLLLFLALYFLTFYSASVRLLSPVRCAVQLFPATFVFTPFAIAASSIITRTGRYRWAICCGFALCTLGSAFLAGLLRQSPPQSSVSVEALWVSSGCLIGAGLGTGLSAITFALQTSIVPSSSSAQNTCSGVKAGHAAGMYTFLRSLGFSLAVPLGGTVFQNSMAARLIYLEVPGAEGIARQAVGYTAQLKALSAQDETRDKILEAYEVGFRAVWITMAIISGVGLLVAVMLVKEYSMDREELREETMTT